MVARFLGRRLEKIVLCELVSAQGAFPLYLDGAGDVAAAKDVFAGRDDGVSGRVVADGTVLLALEVETQGVLQERSVLGVEGDDIVVLEELDKARDAFFAEGPVVASKSVSGVSREVWEVLYTWRRRRSLSRTFWKRPACPSEDLACHASKAPLASWLF